MSTASYEARVFGVRSAMPSSVARRRCPELVFLQPDFAYYHQASRTFHGILSDFTPLVESAGADEAYLDVHGSKRLHGTAAAIGEAIRRRVRNEIGITASVGVSRNKLVSKVASDAAKPDGLLVVAIGDEAGFLAPRPIRELPGIGARTADSLGRLGIRSIGDLAAYPVDALVSRFGKHGTDLHDRALGRLDSPVTAGRGAAKSISREMTFDTDEADRRRLEAIIWSQSERVASDLSRQGRAARTVVLKLRFPPFETLTRSATPEGGVEEAKEIAATALSLFRRAWSANGCRALRLIGVGVTNLRERGHQLALGESGRREMLAEELQRIRGRYGEGAVHSGAAFAVED